MLICKAQPTTAKKTRGKEILLIGFSPMIRSGVRIATTRPRALLPKKEEPEPQGLYVAIANLFQQGCEGSA